MNAFSTFYMVMWLTLLGVSIAWLAWHAWMPSALPRAGAREPACEVCRRPVANAPGLCCPGCGTDLRITGIITRQIEVRRRGTLGSSMSSLVVLWFIVYLFGVRTLEAWIGGRGWDDQGLIIEVSAIAGWLAMGAGSAMYLVRRRWRLAGRGPLRPVLRAEKDLSTPPAPVPAADGTASQAAISLTAWLLVWFGIGGLVVVPVVARVLPDTSWGQRHTLGMDITVAAIVVGWGLLGCIVGRAFFRRSRGPRPAPGDNAGA